MVPPQGPREGAQTSRDLPWRGTSDASDGKPAATGSAQPAPAAKSASAGRAPEEPPARSGRVVWNWVATPTAPGLANTVSVSYFFLGWDRDRPVFAANYLGPEGQNIDRFFRVGLDGHDTEWTSRNMPFSPSLTSERNGRPALPRGDVIVEDRGFLPDAGTMVLTEGPIALLWREPGKPTVRISLPDARPGQRLFFANRSPSGCRLLIEVLPENETIEEEYFFLADLPTGPPSCKPR